MGTTRQRPGALTLVRRAGYGSLEANTATTRHPGSTTGDASGRSNQLQPLVLPQLGHAWQLPARTMWTPHCMHIGASIGR